jgi:murein DD-endopeptidase MepM/ murein hydrolase activator NlpD
VYSPGELVDYTAQTGDTLPLLALRFNTTIEEILEANPFIPQTASTMPPGMPMKIPIYYAPFWGSSFRILPDSLFVNGPAQVGFDTAQFISQQPGWLNGYTEWAADQNRRAAEIIDLVARNYSLSPRLLLALLDFQSGALSRNDPTPIEKIYPAGYRTPERVGLYRQLIWAANSLNNFYYTYRAGRLVKFEHADGREERFDPWQNAASVSLQLFLHGLMSLEAWTQAIGPEGLAQTYTRLFGDPWQADQPHLEGSLEQPPLFLPFEPGNIWAMTGGPHTGWGTGEPLAALDFAPPSVGQGCLKSDVWATAVADGVVVRSEYGEVMLDLDGDGDERTGWNIYYLHVGSEGRAPLGASLKAGDRIGHPSCEGGSSTGTHIHLVRKYNGEWISAGGLAGGFLAFNMEGWIAQSNSVAYQGTLVRMSRKVTACTCSNAASFIQTERGQTP